MADYASGYLDALEDVDELIQKKLKPRPIIDNLRLLRIESTMRKEGMLNDSDGKWLVWMLRKVSQPDGVDSCLDLIHERIDLVRRFLAPSPAASREEDPTTPAARSATSPNPASSQADPAAPPSEG